MIQDSEIKIHTFNRVIDKSWEISNLSAPFWRFYWNEDMSGQLKFQEQKIILKPHCFYLIPPETSCSSKGFYKAYHNFVHFSISPPYETISNGVYEIPAEKIFLSNAKKTFFDLEKPKDEIAIMKTHMQILSLITHCISMLPDEVFVYKKVDSLSEKVIQYMNNNIHQKLEINDLCQFAHTSPQTIFRLFKKNFKNTPINYFSILKMKQACLWLFHTDMKIETISEKLGFSNRYHFTRIFTSFRGISPAQYRKKRGKDYSRN